MQVLAEALGRLDATGIGRDDHEVVPVQPELVLQVAREHRQRREMVEREVEVPLDLARVQVDRHDPVRARGRQQVGQELGADRLAREHLLVLPRVAVVRDYGRDPLGGRAFHRVDQDQLLHDRLVHGVGVRLDHEHVGAPHRFLGADVDLARTEPADHAGRDRDAEMFGDLLGQCGMRRAPEQHHPLLGDDLHLSAPPCLSPALRCRVASCRFPPRRHAACGSP